MTYELDRDPALEPSLSEMVDKAIDILSKNKNGFFLFVECKFSKFVLIGIQEKF